MSSKVASMRAEGRRARALKTDDLCIALAGIAALHLDECTRVQMQIYEAIRRIKLLQAAAKKSSAHR